MNQESSESSIRWAISLAEFQSACAACMAFLAQAAALFIFAVHFKRPIEFDQLRNAWIILLIFPWLASLHAQKIICKTLCSGNTDFDKYKVVKFYTSNIVVLAYIIILFEIMRIYP